MVNLNELRKKRFNFLNLLYEKSGGNCYKSLFMRDLGKELGFSGEETETITEYLRGEGLLKYPAMGGFVAITHFGIKEVEEAISHPDQPSDHFPPVNIINIHHMENSQVQQCTSDSSQTLSLGDAAKDEIRELLALLKGQSAELKLSVQQNTDMVADVSTIEAQLQSSKPKTNVIKECLSSIRTILERAGGSFLAVEALKCFPKILDLIK